MFRVPRSLPLLVLCGAAAALPTPAAATVASEQVNAGSLAFINGTPADLAFPAVTLDGTDQTVTQPQAFDVSDATGAHAGWSITATSTTFTAAGHTLSNTATTVQSAPPTVCDGGSSCTLATNSISYPYVLPAASTAPVATKLYNAAAGTGMGNQTVTPTWTLSVPSDTWAGGATDPYTSTWTFTLVSGP